MTMQRPPLIFLTFSQDYQDSRRFLDNLGREKERLRRTFEEKRERVRGKFALSEEPANWVAELQDCRKEMCVFHFSGHASARILQFMQADGSPALVKGVQIASLFEKELAPSLSLVFLNACATAAQVKYFHQVGVPAVIATPKPVLDSDAFAFSDIFYRSLLDGNTLLQAFNDAIITVSNTLSGGGIHRGFELDRDEIGEKNWGLFLKNKDGGDWRLWEAPPTGNLGVDSGNALSSSIDWKQLQKYLSRNQFRKVLKILESSVSEEDQIGVQGLIGQLEEIETKSIQGIYAASEESSANNQFRYALLQFVNKLKNR